jgi:predicted acylesterase/phospholipase RssA
VETGTAASSQRPRRSLILAGGGYKVAYQAGVLQVWLDEAGLTFDHADGASGGNLNLAMMCQGMSGTRIAQNWRDVAPISGVGLNWREWPKLIYARSLLSYDRFRHNVLPAWKLDWEQIRNTSLEATFNVYDFTHNRLEPRPASEMSEEMLIASITLPMWFPPVVTPEATYIDAVFLTDGNLEEALRRNADELWIIWTVSQKGEWYDGLVGDYFGIIETVANGNLQRVLDRIEANNAAIANGGSGEFGRHVTVKMHKAEVPLHYLVILGSDRVSEAVNQGVVEARRWCREQGIPLREPGPRPADPTRFRFVETMSGHVALDEVDPAAGDRRGRALQQHISLKLTIAIDGLATFMTDPNHPAQISGTISSDVLGGRLPIVAGTFNLLVDDGDPADRRFRYRLQLSDAVGHPLTLVGEKVVHDDPGFDVWADTSTLMFRIYSGHEQDGDAAAIGSGIARISVAGFLKELTTFNVQAASTRQRASLLARFGRLFFGKLWDVYLRRLLPYSPI